MNLYQIGCRSVLSSAAACLALASTTEAVAASQVLWVAPYGVDTAHCGDRTHQCRSISQAIENASAGATIEVAPGHYGDLNYDGQFDQSGEEHFDPQRGCVVCITKPVRILSLFGATETVIDANNVAKTQQYYYEDAVVHIYADNVTFGTKDHGFTVLNGSDAGILAKEVDYLRISGNIVLKNYRAGMSIQARDSATSVLIADNIAIDNDFGISTRGRAVSVVRNFALGNIVGMAFTDSTVVNNIATANSNEGMILAGRNSTLRDNVMVGNPDAGLDVGIAAGSTISHNTITGSRFGVNVGDTSGETVAVTSSNLYGNDACGLINTSATVAQAVNNFWGATSGPGPRPADQVCNYNGSTTIVSPFATTEFPIYHPN